MLNQIFVKKMQVTISSNKQLKHHGEWGKGQGIQKQKHRDLTKSDTSLGQKIIYNHEEEHSLRSKSHTRSDETKTNLHE